MNNFLLTIFFLEMSQVFVKPYSDYEISGKDFATVRNTNMRRIVFTPDNAHSISLKELPDGCLVITNGSRTPFDFTISREKKIIASVKFAGGESVLRINSNFRLSESGVENREIHENPDLVLPANLNINLVRVNGIGRIDLKIDGSGYAACVFSERELLFVRMNCHRCVPRLEGFMANQSTVELRRVLSSPEVINMISTEVKNQIGRKYFQDWCNKHRWGAE